MEKDKVVDCFQICIFVLGNTTLVLVVIVVVRLWIAFKFVSLYWVTQLNACKSLKTMQLQGF